MFNYVYLYLVWYLLFGHVCIKNTGYYWEVLATLWWFTLHAQWLLWSIIQAAAAAAAATSCSSGYCNGVYYWSKYQSLAYRRNNVIEVLYYFGHVHLVLVIMSLLLLEKKSDDNCKLSCKIWINYINIIWISMINYKHVEVFIVDFSLIIIILYFIYF